MARFNPADILSSYSSVAALNTNFDNLSTLMDRVVFRDGTSPNGMLADLDLNHFKLTNVADAVDNTDAVPYGQMASEFMTITRGPAGPDTQEVLDDLLTAVGAGSVGFQDRDPNAVLTTVSQKMKEQALSALDFLTGVKRNDVLNKTGLYDHSAELNLAIQAAIDTGRALYIPGGLWNDGVAGTAHTRFFPTLADGQSLIIFGDGPGETIIRRAAGQTNSDFKDMFRLYAPNGVTVRNCIIRDMTLDMNGTSNGVPPTPYEWQHSHIITIGTPTSAGTGIFDCTLFANLELRDKVGGGVVLASGTFNNVLISNVHGRGFGALVGQRGDIESQAITGNIVVDASSGYYIQTEPNITSASGKPYLGTIRNSNFEIIDLAGFSADITSARWVLMNSRATKKLIVADVKLNILGGSYRVGSVDDAGNSSGWQTTAPGSSMISGEIVIRTDTTANATSPVNFRIDGTGGFYFDFHGTQFVPDTGFVNGVTTGAAIGNSASTAYVGALPFRVRMFGVRFDPRFQQSLNAYRNGIWELYNPILAGWGTATAAAVVVGGAGTAYSRVKIVDPDYTNVTSQYKYLLNNSNTLWNLEFDGVQNLSDFTYTWSAVGYEPYVKFGGQFLSNGPPVGPAIAGMRVRNTLATAVQPIDYLCTVSGKGGPNAVFQATPRFLTFSKTFDWPSLAAATTQSTTITADGAALGDSVSVSHNKSLAATRIWGEVTTGSIAATGTITFTAQPANGSTITIAGVVYTFVTALTTGNQILIGATLANTLTAAAAALNASTSAVISMATYSASPTVLTITHDSPGTVGNTFAIAVSGTANGTVSAGTLTGGTAGIVTVYQRNETAGAVDVASGTLSATVTKLS